MPISSETFNKDLYNLLKTKGYRPIPLDFARERTNPEDAVVFEFEFKKDGESYGTAYVSAHNKVTVYYDEEQADSPSAPTKGLDYDDTWSGFLEQISYWAMSKQKEFETENKDRLGDDLAQRKYIMDKENINEGYYPMGKQASYSDSVPTVKIILQHTRQIQEGEQRFRNVAKIFLENQLGERILAPTTRPGIAQVYARHLAEGGVPNDERWNHIKGLCEEYSKMAGFVRAVKNHEFNESAQQLVSEGVNHYTNLRETLSRMRGQRGYNSYFESWTPTLMEDESSDNTLNELFVQETLDPRIESVLPILSKLRKSVAEMKEVDELAEWADNLTEAPGAMTLKHNQNTEKSNLKAFDLDEDDDAVQAGQVARDKIKKPAFMRKTAGEKPATLGDVERSQQHRSSQAMVGQKGQEVEESGLQAYLGNKKYGKEGMDALRKAGRDGASKEKMAKIRAKYDKLDEEGLVEGDNTDLKMKLSKLTKAPDMFDAIYDSLTGDDELGHYLQDMYFDTAREYRFHLDDDVEDIILKMADQLEHYYGEEGVAEGSGKNVIKSVKVGNFRHDLVDTGMGWQVRIYNGDELYDTGMSKNSEQKGLAALEDAVAYTEKQTRTKRQGVAEGLSEMDNRTPSGDRREQRANSPEERNRREKELQDLLKKTPPELRKKLGLPEPKEQGVAEGWGFDQWGHDTWTDAQKEVARKKKNEKQRAQRQQNKDQQKSKQQGVAEDDAGDVEQRFLAKMEKEKQRLAKLKQTDPEAYKREMAKRKTSGKIPPVSTFEDQGVAEGSEQTNESLDRLLYLANIETSKKKVDESIDDIFSLGGELRPTNQIYKDSIKGQASQMAMTDILKQQTINRLLDRGFKEGELQGKELPELIQMSREGREGVGEGGMPSSVIKSKQRYSQMTPEEFAKAHGNKSDEELKAMAWRHGYGKGSTHYVDKRNKGKQGVAEGLNEMDKSAPQPGRDGKISHSTYGSRDKKGSDYFKGREALGKPVTAKKAAKDALDILKKQGVAEGEGEGKTIKNSLHTIIRVATHLERQIDDSEDFAEWESETIGSIKDQMVKIMDYEISKKEQQGVAEDLDANQKRVGQLGPTEKVKNNNIGKLVGANESLELNEMDKSQPSSDRGGESSGDPYAKGGKATPVKAKDAEKDAEEKLNNAMDKAHKKEVKEGQEDLDAILRIIRK